MYDCRNILISLYLDKLFNMKKLTFILIAIALISCDNKTIGETKLNPEETVELKYIRFENLGDFLYQEKSFETKIDFSSDTLNSSFYELDKGNYSEIYTIDSIFSGYANSEAYAYNESFFNEMASQEIIDDYNKKQLWEKHKSMFESQFTRYGQAGGYHGPTREYIRANLKDPLSYEELKIGYEFYDSESDVVEAFSLDGPALFVGVEYSAKNSFGGRVRGEFRAFWNPDGSLKLVIVDE